MPNLSVKYRSCNNGLKHIRQMASEEGVPLASYRVQSHTHTNLTSNYAFEKFKKNYEIDLLSQHKNQSSNNLAFTNHKNNMKLLFNKHHG